MDVIQKQSLQSSSILISGSIIGALSTIFVYPADLSLYGIYGFLTNAISLLVPFVSFGFGNVLLRYYPYFKQSEDSKHQFFGFVFSGYFLGSVIYSILFLAFNTQITQFFIKSDPHILNYVIYLLPLGLLYVLYDLCTMININYQKITIPAYAVFLFKIVLPLLFILCAQRYLNKFQFFQWICIFYIGAISWLLIYIIKKENIKFKFSFDIMGHPLLKQMLQFALFTTFGGASAMIAMRIDSLLVTAQLGSEANGLFTLALFISNVSFIPTLALTDSLNAVVSSMSKLNKPDELQNIYVKSSKNMLIPTLWIAICIYISFSSLSNLMPNSEKVILIKPVLVWLLLARIIDAATGVNHHILSYSKYFKLEFYLLILMASLNISLIYILLPKYGIYGAAFATFASIFTYNILKTGIVFLKLKIHPFSKSTAWILIIGFFICYFISEISLPFHPILNILCYSSMATIGFLGLVIYFKLSPEFNKLCSTQIIKIAGYLKLYN